MIPIVARSVPLDPVGCANLQFEAQRSTVRCCSVASAWADARTKRDSEGGLLRPGPAPHTTTADNLGEGVPHLLRAVGAVSVASRRQGWGSHIGYSGTERHRPSAVIAPGPVGPTVKVSPMPT